jgi:hypothetical protein
VFHTAPYTLTISRERVAVKNQAGTSRDVAAMMTRCVEGGAVKILAVGDEARGIDTGLMEAFAAGRLKVRPQLTTPGEDPRWTPYWKWPPPEQSVLPEANSYLAICPLLDNSWSPLLARGLLGYALMSSGVRGVLRPFRYQLEVRLADEFSQLEKAELFDALDDLPVRARLSFPEDPTIVRRTPTRLERQLRMNRALMGLFLLCAITLFYLIPRTLPNALFATLFAFGALTLFDKRDKRLKSALEREAPRRASKPE